MLPITLGRLIVAGIIAFLIGYGGYMMSPALLTPLTDIRLEPETRTVIAGESFSVSVVVSSEQPVNVFQGELVFDPEILTIESIDYNTSIADLWAERPWYSNGEGTLNFAGGTTKPGGFTGEGSLITVTFETIKTGEASISMSEARVLKHDGLGTDAEIEQPIDAIFEVSSEQRTPETVVEKSTRGPKLTVLQEPPTTDLNGDGRQSILDVSIFMSDLATQNMKSDFNLDGRVNLADLSILNDQ